MAHGPSATETRHLRTLFSLGAAGMLTVGQLLERFASRDGDRAELAFAALVERHGPMVLRVARAALGDDPSAHDAFQATFLILARKARTLWVRDSLGPWLHAVACRVASHSRALEARRKHHERAASRPEARDPREWARDELARAIHEEIDRLPHSYRLAIVACHLEGLTQQDAARRLGWPVGTLQSRLARGRRKLRDRLQRRGFAPSAGVLAGKLAPAPHALVASTAKAAATLNLGGAIAGMIAPAVLAMIETTTKGMLMTKLKLGAMALVVVVGLVGSGMVLSPGRDARATEGPAVEVPRITPAEGPQADASPPAAILVPIPAKGELRPKPPPPASRPHEPLVDPVGDIRPPGVPILLHFFADWAAPCRQMRSEVEKLAQKGYPIKAIDIERSQELGDRYQVNAVPTFVLVDDAGRELCRTAGLMPAAKLAEFYNRFRFEMLKKARADADLAGRGGIALVKREPTLLEPGPPIIAQPKTDEKSVPTDSFPRPVDTTGFPILLYFHDFTDGGLHMAAQIRMLISYGYPIKLIDYNRSPELVKKYGVFALATIVLVDGQGEPIAELTGDLPALKGNSPALQIARFYNLNCLKLSEATRRVDGPGKAVPKGPAAIEEPVLTPSPEPDPLRTVSDQDRRLNELERKIDQVLKALEGLKGGKLWDSREEVSPNRGR